MLCKRLTIRLTEDGAKEQAWVLLAGSSGFDLGCWAFCRPGAGWLDWKLEWACLGHNLYGGAFTPGAQT